MPTSIHEIVDACRRGEYEALVRRVSSGWAVMGEKQVLRGYCLLLPDPVVPDLNALDPEARSRFLDDMGQLGDAVLAVTRATRINYAIFGNLDPALHAHVVPRYADEPDAYRTGNPWGYDWAVAPVFSLDKDSGLLESIRDELASRDR